MISALQAKLQSINSSIENSEEIIPSKKEIVKQENPWAFKKYSEQMDLLVNFFTARYPNHPEDLINISCKSLLDKLTVAPEKSESIIILSEKGDRIVDLQNIIWKKRRTLHFQFCKPKNKNSCTTDEIENIRKKVRELYSLTELHLITQNI